MGADVVGSSWWILNVVLPSFSHSDAASAVPLLDAQPAVLRWYPGTGLGAERSQRLANVTSSIKIHPINSPG